MERGGSSGILVPVCALIVMVWLPAVVVGQQWRFETIDAPHWYAGDGLGHAADADGHPHLAYGGDQLVHAWHDGAEWQFEVVDATAGCGGAASIAIGGNGSIHIAYSGPSGELRYALLFAGVWSTWTLDASAETHDLDLALDASDEPHIAYINSGDYWVYLMIDQGNGSWGEPEALVRARTYASRPAVVVAGYATKVLYERPSASGWELGYMYWGGSSWTDELVDSGTGSLSSYEMILDGTNQPHVGYSGRSSPESWVRYANRDGTGWHAITATSASSDFSTDFVSASIALDSAGQPMITSQFILGGSTLGLHRRVCAPICFWTYEEFDWGYDVGSSATVLNVMGTPTVAYVNNDLSELRLARRGASTWAVETVDVFADVGLPSIVVDDTTGLVHVSYGDLYNSALRYAQRFSGGWFHTVIDRAPDPMYRPFSSIDLDTLGDPQIAYTSYMGDGTFMLRWAVDQGNGSWEWYDVTDLGVSPGVPSMQLAGGAPRISFYDSYNQDLGVASKYATWSFMAVDTGANAGGYSALALDADNHPHVAYTAGSPAVLKYAWEQCSTICWWTTEVVDASVQVDAVAIALDPVYGRPRIAYHDRTNSALRYAAKYSGGWAPPQTIDTSGEVGRGVSIALEGVLPHISYIDDSHGNLKHAWEDCDGGDCEWFIEVVDDSGDIGGGSAIAVDGLGRVHIAYDDVTRRDVLYAFLPGSAIFSDGFESSGTGKWSSTVN